MLKTGIGFNKYGYDISDADYLALLKSIGFSSFFSGYKNSDDDVLVEKRKNESERVEFGDLLVGTHIHDNFGQSDPRVITWNDDSHILPFDGTIDFRKFGRDIKKCGYNGTLTLEIGKNQSIPWYRVDTLEEYLRMAYERVAHIASLCE